NRSHWSTSKTPSYTKSVSWQHHHCLGNDSNLLIVFYVQIMPDDLVMQLHRF
ncbi:transposase, partial [Escherichia coli]